MRYLLGLLLTVVCGATTLTGTLQGPGGATVDGYLILSISQQAALSAAGGCGGPILVVPGIDIRIKVTAGALVAPPAIFGNDCLLPQGTYYNVKVTDNNANILFTDHWLIQGGTQNLGNIVSTVLSGTTNTLGGVGVIQTVPPGDQVITQPGATYLKPNNLDVTALLGLPDGSGCDPINCQFNTVIAATKGINTGNTFPSNIWIGNTSAGNLWIRVFSGGDISCVAVMDGWVGLRTDTKMLELCSGGNRYGVQLVAIP